MTMDHVKELLSPYLDGALGAAEKERVEGHLSGCGGCREELEDLRRVSRMVAGLPKHPLPAGFLDRLQAKRSAEGAAPAFWSPAAWELSPARLAAVAACGIAVMVVVYRGAADRLGRRVATLSEEGEVATGVDRPYSLLETAAPAAQAPTAESELKSVSMREQARGAAAFAGRGAKEERAERQAAADQAMGAASMDGAGAGSGGRLAMPAGPKSLGGEPYKPGGGKRGYTNEALQSFLEKERERMGIQEIVPSNAEQAEQPPAEEVPDRPLSKDEAMAYMRSMTRQLSSINRARRSTKPGPVTLEDKAVPKLLAEKDKSLPMEGRSGSDRLGSVESNMPGISGAAASTALAGAAGGMVEAGPVAKGALARRKAAAPPAAAPEPAASAQPATAPGAAPVWSQAWSGTNSHMAAAGGAVIQTAGDWTDLWGRLQTGKPVPALDFSRSMAVAVFGGGEFGLRPVEIVAVAEEGGKLRIRYRRLPVDAKADNQHASAPYHIVVVPRSSLPPAFEEVR